MDFNHFPKLTYLWPHISAMLMEHGRSPTTPAAIIERGTNPCERIVTGTLGDLAERALQARVRPPATIVIGDVVRIRERLVGTEQAEGLFNFWSPASMIWG